MRITGGNVFHVSHTIRKKSIASSKDFLFCLIVLCIIHCTTHSPSSGLLIIHEQLEHVLYMQIGFLVLDEGEPYDDMVQHRRKYLFTYHQSTFDRRFP